MIVTVLQKNQIHRRCLRDFCPIVCVIGLIGGIVLGAEKEKFTFEKEAMGTRFSVVMYGHNREEAKKAAEHAFAICEKVNAVASDYNKESELSKIGNHAIGEEVRISKMLFEMLNHSRIAAEATKGAFDPTMGQLTKLWRETKLKGKLPDEPSLAKARTKVGWEFFHLDEKRLSISVKREGLMFDLGGVAKGYAADLMLDAMKDAGFLQTMIVAGGDVRLGDAPPGRDGWGVAVRTFDHQGNEEVLVLANAAVSTSGDLYQWIEVEGVRYSHIIDPATGLGLRKRVAATVIADEGKWSDPLATAACVLGENGAGDLRKMKGVREVRIFTLEEE